MTTVMPETETTITSVVTEETEVPPPETSNRDPDVRHMVNPAMNMDFQRKYGYCEEAQDVVDIARVRGVEITALCGAKFVPTRSPEGLKTCDPCIEEAGRIMNEES